MAECFRPKKPKKNKNTKSSKRSSEGDGGVPNDLAILETLQEIEQIRLALLKVRAKTRLNDFLKTIRNCPSALSLYKIYTKENDFNALAEIFIISTRKNSYWSVSDAIEAYRKSGNHFCLSVCEEQLKLLTLQRELKQKIRQETFMGKTVNETCWLLLKYDVKSAEAFKKEYKIPDRRFYWLKIQYLVDTGKWDEMRKLSKMRTCPLGIDSFIDICLLMGKTEKALEYLPNVEKTLSVKYHIKCGLLEEAAALALEKRDEFSLLLIRSECEPRSELSEKVNSYISKLRGKK